MKRRYSLRFEFVEFVPDAPDEGVLYITISHATAVHRCCCGCGVEVVTPLAPAAWTLLFDGETVSLKPSIGNWSLPCRSHYWIDRSRVQWARSWSDGEARVALERDQRAHRGGIDAESGRLEPIEGGESGRPLSWWKRFRSAIRRR